jgi:hypothetical protein
LPGRVDARSGLAGRRDHGARALQQHHASEARCSRLMRGGETGRACTSRSDAERGAAPSSGCGGQHGRAAGGRDAPAASACKRGVAARRRSTHPHRAPAGPRRSAAAAAPRALPSPPATADHRARASVRFAPPSTTPRRNISSGRSGVECGALVQQDRR